MSLQDKLDKLRDDFENGRLPLVPTAEQLETMHRATKTLIDNGQADRALKAGENAPHFSLSDPEGNIYNLPDLLVRGPVVVTFYRGVWCPFCNLDLAALEAERGEIEARGAQLLAISPQTPANSRRSQRDNKLNFPILSDPDSEVAETFGLRFSLPDELMEVYKSFGSNLSHFNAGQDWRLPMPARYVIGRDGLIAYSEINPDYTRRPDPSELLPVLDKLRSN